MRGVFASLGNYAVVQALFTMGHKGKPFIANAPTYAMAIVIEVRYMALMIILLGNRRGQPSLSAL